MPPHKPGILPDWEIAALIRGGQVRAARRIDLKKQLQPASLDLRLRERAYRVPASFLPREVGRFRDLMNNSATTSLDLRKGAVLDRGAVYLVPLQEYVNLPREISARANPKSSIGRIDVFVRLVSERGQGFDDVPAGYRGPLYLEISPRSFPILVRAGDSLSQLRFLWDAPAITPLPRTELKLSGGSADEIAGEPLSVRLRPEKAGAPIGYRARQHTRVLDLAALNKLRVKDFWEELHAENGELVLTPDAFYILSSRERVYLHNDEAGEILPFNPLMGEFRVHYAGFFDPGFGGTRARGAHAVLEVRSHEVPFLLRHGQEIGHLHYLPLTSPAKRVYGKTLGSHYQAQSLRLSKHFRQPALVR